jgi:hypothetical protein
MLKQLILTLVIAMGAIGATSQHAAAGGNGGAHLEDFGTIVIEVQTPATSGGGGRGQGSAGGGSAPSGCYTGGGVEVPCYQWGLAWRPDLQCYARVKAVQPPLTDAIWNGRTEGTIVECLAGTAGGWSTAWDMWVAAAALAAPPDPAVLARRAVERMQLSGIRMGTFPEQAERAPRDLGYVGWNSWMWVANPSPSTWGPITRSVSEAGYTVTATGQVAKVVWDMGDGTTVTCGQGKPWRSIWVNNEPSPDCGHMYAKDGEYTITATSYWVVNWSGIGQTGTITLQLDDTATLRIAEVQVVNVRPES